MHTWKDFLDSLDCPGGHIVILVLLGLVGVTLTACGLPDAGKPILEALPIAFYAMRGTAKANGKPNDEK